MLDDKYFHLAPADVRKLIPGEQDGVSQFIKELNRLIQFPTTVGIQSTDYHLANIRCCARGP